jgi:hypothetical protein
LRLCRFWRMTSTFEFPADCVADDAGVGALTSRSGRML